MLKIYNSLGRTKQEFVPLRPGEVRMYVCGMTVYDYLHLGHARMLMVFDVVQRWLRASGYRVTYVRNITDIDDKIIRRALENRESIGELTARFIRCIDEDAAALGVQKPDHEPRATSTSPCAAFPGTACSRGNRSTSCAPASASRSTPPSKTLSTSCSGSAPSPTSRTGLRATAKGGRAGTSNAPPWAARCSASISTSTAAARTCSSRTTRTRSRSPRARMA